MPVLLTPVVSGNPIKANDINQYLTCVVASSYLMSGTTPSVPASLTLTYGVQQATILDSGTNAAIFVYLAAGSSTFGANQDIYVDLGYSGGYNGSAANGTLAMVAGANGFTPSATPAGQMRLWKVVTGAGTITSVTLLAPVVPLPTSAGVANGLAVIGAHNDLYNTTAPAVRCYNSTNITVPPGAWTALTFDSNFYDIGTASAQHSTSSNTDRLVCQAAGVYAISGNVSFALASAGWLGIEIVINRSGHSPAPLAQDMRAAFGIDATSLSVSGQWLMNVGDYSQLQVFQSSGASLTLYSADLHSPAFGWARVP